MIRQDSPRSSTFIPTIIFMGLDEYIGYQHADIQTPAESAKRRKAA